MLLVHRTKGQDGELTGKFEVAWTWVPFFIATNPDVVKHVHEEMTKKFVGKELSEELFLQMHDEVINLIDEKMKIKGLVDYLRTVKQVRLGE